MKQIRTQYRIPVLFIIAVFLTFILFGAFGIHPLFASHEPISDVAISSLPEPSADPNPCYTVQGIETDGPAGSGGDVLSVPVNDTVARDLLGNIEGDTAAIEGRTLRIQEYLRLLCEKEYEQDHTLQHAWANLIGEFVRQTTQFVLRGYQGNPAFLTNQTAYYQIVNIAVSRVFMQDIVDSGDGAPDGNGVGPQTKRRIIEDITNNLYDNFFPYTGPTIANEDLPPALAEGWQTSPYATAEEYYTALNDFYVDAEQQQSNVIAIARRELSTRLADQLAQEQEKLNWGRGFFSYEICDLAVYLRADGSVNPEDRRNCRIATPGSLIQDQVSFVFGSALRQMELNDEYEEWVPANTLATLSDILSFRGLNTADSRNDTPAGSNIQVTTNAAPPPVEGGTGENIVDLIDGIESNGPEGQQNSSGPLPYEFSNTLIDVELWGLNGGDLGAAFFDNLLDPEQFLNQVGQ